jgi:sec-independent protein translocase protein TatA
MPLGIGPMEVVVVLVIALLVIGPKKLPDMAKSMGSGVREFRDSLANDRDEEPEAPRVVAEAPRVAADAGTREHRAV